MTNVVKIYVKYHRKSQKPTLNFVKIRHVRAEKWQTKSYCIDEVVIVVGCAKLFAGEFALCLSCINQYGLHLGLKQLESV